MEDMKSETYLNDTNLAIIVVYPQAGHTMNFHCFMSLYLIEFIATPFICSFVYSFKQQLIKDLFKGPNTEPCYGSFI